MASEVVVARAPRDTSIARKDFKTGIVPDAATADESAREFIGRLGHFQIFEQVFESFAACVGKMFGWRGQVFGALAKDGKLGCCKGILLGASSALLGEYANPFLKKVSQLARVARASLYRP